MNDAASVPMQLEDFVNDVLTEKNLPGLTDESRPEVVAQTVQTLRELIDMAVIDAMPAHKQAELNKMIDGMPEATPEEIWKVIESSDVDVEKVTADTMLRFKELYLAGPGDGEG